MLMKKIYKIKNINNIYKMENEIDYCIINVNLSPNEDLCNKCLYFFDTKENKKCPNCLEYENNIMEKKSLCIIQ